MCGDLLDSQKYIVGIKVGRSLLGLSQSDLANMLDVSQSAVARLERFESTLSADMLLVCMRLFKQNGLDIRIAANGDLEVIASEKILHNHLQETRGREEFTHIKSV